MHLPSDDSKNVYLLEGYHLIHCVVSALDEHRGTLRLIECTIDDHQEDFLGGDQRRGEVHLQASTCWALYRHDAPVCYVQG